MATFEWPCPKCGTPQKVRAPSGTEVNAQKLCAACEEKESAGKAPPERTEAEPETFDLPSARAREKKEESRR
jgi:pyruvate/2-oxoglutarate dehydrogenase complex dihydrolipoamide acyltransferase (E2) component